MGTKKIKIIMIFASMIIFLALVKNRFVINEVKFLIEFESLDNGVEYQFFYKTNDNFEFIEEQTVKLLTNGDGLNFKKYQVEIFTENDITDFRIDFGSEPKFVQLKNFTIVGKKSTNLSAELIAIGFNNEIDSHIIHGDVLEVVSYNNDPYSVVENVNLQPMIYNKGINVSKLVDWCLIYFFILFVISYIYKKRKNINLLLIRLKSIAAKLIISKLLLVLVIIFIFLFATRDLFITHDYIYNIEFESIDNGIEYQIFYTTKSSQIFLEENSINILTDGSDIYKQYNAIIYEQDEIVDLRLDFGREPGYLKVKNIKLYGEVENEIEFDTITQGFNDDIERYEVTDDHLVIISSHSDPYSVIRSFNSKPILKKIINYKKIFDCLIIFLFALCLLKVIYLFINDKNSLRIISEDK